MSQTKDSSKRTQVSVLSKQLCYLLTNKQDDKIFKKFILTLASTLNVKKISDFDCTEIIEKIKRHLILSQSESYDAVPQFETLTRRLKKSDVISNKPAVLVLLLKLSQLNEGREKDNITTELQELNNSSKLRNKNKILIAEVPQNWLGKTSTLLNSSSSPAHVPLMMTDIFKQTPNLNSYAKRIDTDKTGGIRPNLNSSSLSVNPMNWKTSGASSFSFSGKNLQPVACSTAVSGKQPKTKSFLTTTKPEESDRNKTSGSLEFNAGIRSVCHVNNLSGNHSISYKTEVSEVVIIKELLFCFQGIEGQIIRLDPSSEGFIIDPKAKINNLPLVLRLMELGFLHNVIKNYVESSHSKSSIQQGLVMSLRDELSEFYKLVSRLHSEVAQDEELIVNDSPLGEENQMFVNIVTHSTKESLTLKRLVLRTTSAFVRLSILVDMIEELKTCHGGKIISVIHKYMHYGDPSLTPVFVRLLHTTTHSLLVLMCHWIIDGQLFDPYDEFFIANNKVNHGISCWDSQFVLRESMIPDFMSKEEAAYVLQAGRCIYFLNEICNEKTEVSKARGSFRQLEICGGDLLPMMEPFNSITELIERAHEESSKLVLDILCQKFNLYEHLHGLRKYMLLGQGDFIRYLMEMIEHELDGSAHILFQHNLMSILETAIRSTNAQFDNPVILNSLVVEIMEPSDGDSGWDVFRLEYRLNGPLATIFKKNENEYCGLFNFLWNIKRLEYVLSKLWRNQRLISKHFSLIPELKSVFVLSCSLISEMVHFIHQLQYYFLTEVLETQWHEFEQVVNKAGSLEEVVEAHDLFLSKVKSGLLQDRMSLSFNLQLQLVKDVILEVKAVQTRFIELVNQESERRIQRLKKIEEAGTNEADEIQNDKCLWDFTMDHLKSIKAQFSVISRSYQEFLRKLLLDLSKHPLIEVQMLSSRIDFNEFYKQNDSQLSESIKLSSRKERFQTFD